MSDEQWWCDICGKGKGACECRCGDVPLAGAVPLPPEPGTPNGRTRWLPHDLERQVDQARAELVYATWQRSREHVFSWWREWLRPYVANLESAVRAAALAGTPPEKPSEWPWSCPTCREDVEKLRVAHHAGRPCWVSEVK